MKIKNVIMYLYLVAIIIGLWIGYHWGYRMGRSSVIKDQIEQLPLDSNNQTESRDLNRILEVLAFLERYHLQSEMTLKEIKAIDELLMGNLLKLDEVTTNSLKTIRKTLVKDIQAHQRNLDQRRLDNRVQETTDQEAEKLDFDF